MNKQTMNPEQCQAFDATEAQKDREIGWTLTRMDREMHALALAIRWKGDDGARVRYNGMVRERARLLEEREQITFAREAAAALAAAWTPADAAREQLVAWWRRLADETERKRIILQDRGIRPDLQKQEAFDSWQAAYLEQRALAAVVEPLVCAPGEHPYTHKTEVPPAHVLGATLARRLRMVEPPARYAWQDLANTARGVTRETVAA